MLATRILTPEAQAGRDFATAALGVAGHEITDPEALDLLDRHAMGEVSTADAIREARRIAGID